jgi:phosphoribosylaminoimidazole-succinocarboxamide synthase
MSKMLYEGKAKKIFSTEKPNEIIVYYKDDATALNGLKKGTIVDKGIMNNTITSFFFELLGKNGIPHHQIKITTGASAKVAIIPKKFNRKILPAALPRRWWKRATSLKDRWSNSITRIRAGDPMINADTRALVFATMIRLTAGSYP